MILPILFLLVRSEPETARLSIADLPAYKAALGDRGDDATSVSFRELWENPRSLRGRRVRVEGHVRRRFQQPAVGEFPALSETWISSVGGDPICLISPSEKENEPRIGEVVEFRGTFLRLVRYRGGDVERIAPLIVGGRPPAAMGVRNLARKTSERGSSQFEILLAAGAAGVVLVILALKYLNRPMRKPTHDGPAPRFLDEEGVDESP